MGVDTVGQKKETRWHWDTLGTWLRRVVILVLLTFALFPCYWMLVSSLRPPHDLFTVPPRLLPTALTTQWYEVVLRNTKMPRYFLNSLVVSSLSMCVSILIATLGAYSMTRFWYPGQRTVLLCVLGSYVLPPVLLLLPLYLTLGLLGLINTYTGVIVTHVTFSAPFCLWLLRSFFRAIPVDLEEAAMVDGTTRLGAFARIVLPIAAPGILSTGLFGFIQSWNEYLFASVLLTGEARKTVPIGIAEFISQFDIRWGEVMAASALATIPVVFLFCLIQRHFVRGLMAGAIKG
jgi:ABC-type glycerol-3-phosphate transport system permease component